MTDRVISEKRKFLYGGTFFNGFVRVVFLTTEPIQNSQETEHNTNPIHGRTNRFDDVFESPLEAVGYWAEDALQVHG